MNRKPWRTGDIRVGALLAAAVLGAAGCGGGVSAQFDRNPSVPIPAGASYAWGPSSPGEDPRAQNPAVQGRIRRAVDAVLAQRGFRQGTPGAADFLVEYRLGLRDQTMRIQQALAVCTTPGIACTPTGGPVTDIDYTEGKLVIDLVQPSTGQVAYRGTGQAVVKPGSPRSDAELQEAIAKILQGLP